MIVRTQGDGKMVRVTVGWRPETLDSLGEHAAREYQVHVGIGRPESPFPGRQFKAQIHSVQTVNTSPTDRLVITELNISLAGSKISTGKKDVLVSVMAKVDANTEGGRDRSGAWPNLPAGEWREVDSLLKQDAIEIRSGAPPATPRPTPTPTPIVGDPLEELIGASGSSSPVDAIGKHKEPVRMPIGTPSGDILSDLIKPHIPKVIAKKSPPVLDVLVPGFGAVQLPAPKAPPMKPKPAPVVKPPPKHGPVVDLIGAPVGGFYIKKIFKPSTPPSRPRFNDGGGFSGLLGNRRRR